MWWWTGVAAALELHPSPDAKLYVLPQTRPGIVEIGVYENRAPLRQEVINWNAKELDFARAVDVGGSTTFVSVHLLREDRTLQLTKEDDHWRVDIRPAALPSLVPPQPVTVEDLARGVLRRQVPPRDDLPLPLVGTARTFTLEPSSLTLGVGPIEMPDPPAAPPTSLDAVSAPTWGDVERWRSALPRTRQPTIRATLYVRLGQAHAALGLHREAAYYFGEAEKWVVAPPALHLARAEALIRSRQYQAARDECANAVASEDAAVVRCFGAVALATAEPAPAEVGRLLAAVGDSPKDAWLAGELLLLDGYASEAAPLLRRAAEGLTGTLRAMAWTAAGDAELLLSHVPEARESYLTAQHDVFDSALTVREIATRMLDEGIARWPTYVPELNLIADRGGKGSWDALHVLSTIHRAHGDRESEAEALSALWDEDRAVRPTWVTARFLDACGARIEQLSRDQRIAEVAALWSVCWRPPLIEDVRETAPLAHAAFAFRFLGLPEEALKIQTDLVSILAGQGRESATELGHLAELRLELGEASQAIETVGYAEKIAETPEEKANLQRILGEAALVLGDRTRAREAFARAASFPGMKERMAVRVGVIDLHEGRCADAVASLWPIPAAPGAGKMLAGEVELELAWCLDKLGRQSDALTATRLAMGRSSDPRIQSDASWLATAISLRAGVPIENRLGSRAAELEVMRAEEEKHAAWSADFSAWMRETVK